LKGLERSGVDDELTQAGRASIFAARDANARRNRIVHDLLLATPPDDGEPMQWNSFYGTHGHRRTVVRTEVIDVEAVQGLDGHCSAPPCGSRGSSCRCT
jgi:hypothetical protein